MAFVVDGDELSEGTAVGVEGLEGPGTRADRRCALRHPVETLSAILAHAYRFTLAVRDVNPRPRGWVQLARFSSCWRRRRRIVEAMRAITPASTTNRPN